MRSVMLVFLAVILVGVGFLLTRPGTVAPVDPYRRAEERLEAERARGRVDKAEVERLRLALRMVREGVDGPRYKVLRGEALKSATSEISACKITDLTPWLDERVGLADCTFTPLGE